MNKLYASLGGLALLTIWTWGAMEYREAEVVKEYTEQLDKANQENRALEKQHQAASSDIATKWLQQTANQEKINAAKDKEIASLRGSSYFLYRVFNTTSRCRLSEGDYKQSIDTNAEGDDVLRYTLGEYKGAIDQLQACIDTLKSLPCVEY